MIKPVEPKKILCIHDLSGVGRCSLAVILPVLSVMGLQPVALPTVVLSTHTGGLGTPARLDGCAYGEAALEHYHALGLDFDCIYTGYLGGEAQVALAEKAFALWPSAHKVVDPAKTRLKIRLDTVLENFPLYCPKCKQEMLINVDKLNTTVIKEPDA